MCVSVIEPATCVAVDCTVDSRLVGVVVILCGGMLSVAGDSLLLELLGVPASLEFFVASELL